MAKPIDPRELDRLAEDVKKGLICWSDVPEFVDYRYSEALNGQMIVSVYDDAIPGEAQQRYILHITAERLD